MPPLRARARGKVTQAAPLNLAGLAVEVGLGDWAGSLARLGLWAARLELREAAVPVGGSKLGGLPDLIPGAGWPASVDGQPPAFVGQVDLGEVPAEVIRDAPGLAGGGLLSFFAARHPGTGELTGCRVLWTATGERLARVTPGEAAHLRDTALERAVALRPELTLPASIARGALAGPFGVSARGRAAYERLRSELAAAQGAVPPHHRLLGHPSGLRDDVLAEAALLASWAAGSSDGAGDPDAEAVGWRVLLRVDSDDGLGVRWPSGGAAYFCIASAALAAGSFEAVQVLSQPG